MTRNHQNQKLALLERTTRTVTRTKTEGRLDKLPLRKAQALLKRLKRLIRQLSPLPLNGRMRRTLAAAGVAALMLGTRVQGQTSFAAPTQNPFNLDSVPGYASFPDLVDLDGDGDLDLVAGSSDDSLYYYQNTGSAQAPSFAAPVSNAFGMIGGPADSVIFTNPALVDLDGDGDQDLLVSGEYYQGNFYYQENTGSATAPAFGPQQKNPFGLTPTGAYRYSVGEFVDLDGDGDFDLVVWAYFSNAIIYYENSGSASAPAFGSPQNNPFGMASLPSGTDYSYLAKPTFSDLDNDGDLDMIVGIYDSTGVGSFLYQENTGSASSPAFAAQQTNPFNLQPAYYFAMSEFGDLDGDGDDDILAGEYLGGMKYYENTTPMVSVKPPTAFNTLDVFPNPTNGFLNLRWSGAPLQEAQLLDLQGKVLRRIAGSTNSGEERIDLSGIPAGMYLLRAMSPAGVATKKIIVE